MDDFSLLPLAAGRAAVRAEADGYLRVRATPLGLACVELGGGRQKAGDAVDAGAALHLLRRTGDAVRRGDVLAELYFDPARDPAAALGRAREGFSVEGAPPVRQPLVYCTIEKEDD